jgi:hypothetical protein
MRNEAQLHTHARRLAAMQSLDGQALGAGAAHESHQLPFVSNPLALVGQSHLAIWLWASCLRFGGNGRRMVHLAPFYAKWQQRRLSIGAVKETFGALIDESISLALTQGQLVEHVAGIETKADLTAIARVLETQSHLIIQLKNNVVFVIPKAQAPDCESFAAALKAALPQTTATWQQGLSGK